MSSSVSVEAMPFITGLSRLPDLNSASCLARYSGCWPCRIGLAGLPREPSAVWQAAHGEAAAQAQGHGGDPVTSVSLHLCPELCRPDLVQAPDAGRQLIGLPTAGLASVRLGRTEVNVPIDVTDHCDNGIVSGDPRLANATAGRLIADHIVAETVALVEQLKTAPVRVPRAEKFTPTSSPRRAKRSLRRLM